MYTILPKLRNKVLKNIYEISFLQNLADRDYQAAVEKHTANLPVLSTSDQSLVETIKREGVVITSLESLLIPSNPSMFLAAKNLMLKIPKNISGHKNEFVVHASYKQMMEFPEIFLWGLEQRLLNIVENYLGLPVAYHGAYFRRDIANGVEQKSRLWHIDKEDRKVLKIIVYLNDVSDDSGPFQYISQSLTSIASRNIKYDYRYIQDQVIQQVVSPTDCKSCIGVAGTVIFAATGSIFHRGKLPVASDRFTIFYDYTSRRPKHPFYCKSSLPQKDLLLLSTKLSNYERQCVFWQQ